VGGIEWGLHKAGHSTSLLCEIDPAAVAVLKARFPKVPVHLDIGDLPNLGAAEVLTAGFPCQDLSQAGQTKGMSGKKSSLVAHVFALLEKQSVKWVVLENVPFMLQLNKGHALDFVTSSLENLGYKWAYRVINSRAFGLPQRRERVYFVASKEEDPRRVLFVGNEEPTTQQLNPKDQAFGFYWTEGTRGLGWATNAIPTLKSGSTLGIASPPAIWLPSGQIVQPDIRDAERFQGFPADWTLPAETVAKRGARWRLVGNAVTVNAAEWLGRRLANPTAPAVYPEVALRKGQSWPKAAFNVGEGRFSASLSAWPVAIQSELLSQFLKFPPKLLSERATAGFLSRFKASTLGKPVGFVDALENHLAQMRGVASLV